ncbi:hypothetical protein K7X08_019113 [Anisodus acutangulus]|uniref:Uncharacterized protein n=1 Tax=Anisodus acutangulus TaxID=402998 RepID=A0A9Q1MR09_9SOLA|nr:hypothetical protein K7X08_019113 [Anisodus acutangulus]
MEGQHNNEEERDTESSYSLHQPLLKRNRTLSSTPQAIVGAKVSHIESLDYEINENDIFKHDWRRRSRAQTLHCLSHCLFCTYCCRAWSSENQSLSQWRRHSQYVWSNYALRQASQIIVSIGAVSAGLDLGKEGPLIHIGTCIASLLGQCGPDNYRLSWHWLRYFYYDRDKRDLITYDSSSVLRAFMEYCKSGSCGLFGEGGLIMFDVSGVIVRYHVVDIIPVAIIGVIGGLLGSLYNHVLHKVLRLYNLINEKGKLHKLLLASSVSSSPLYARNFKQFNCPNGYYNDLATLLLTTNEDAVRNIFSLNTATEFQVTSLLIFFVLYCILGVITFGIAVPSGLFLPIILMGSGYGQLLGIAMRPYTKIDQGLYLFLEQLPVWLVQ